MTSLQAAFQAFHNEHPRIYARICALADEALQRGHKRYSMSLIFELIRYEEKLLSKKVAIAIPNAHRAYYARLWLSEHSDWPEFFRLSHVKEEAA
jgi:hypothetical protein